MAKHVEVNFDGLVGPTHNYAGLGGGNIASLSNRNKPSKPRAAALQGLEKMKHLHDMGVPQGVLPPHQRPYLPFLRRLGFSGSDEHVFLTCSNLAPRLLSAAYSASAMWTANAATVAPSGDTADGRVHFVPANLIANIHRSIEPDQTALTLKAIFADETRFAHHPPLPGVPSLGDEGAANHTRLFAGSATPGLHIFVYGQEALNPEELQTQRFLARQTREASEAVARLMRLSLQQSLFVRQSRKAIDAGVFHNDVIAVGNGNVLFAHETAFEDPESFEEIARRYQLLYNEPPVLIRVKEGEIPLEECVRTYLFNSQLVTLRDGHMAIIAPTECQESESVAQFLDTLQADEANPINQIEFVDLRESMKNGGGPACLRLRIPLTEAEMTALHHCDVLLNDNLYERLRNWITKHYRETLEPGDLQDPVLFDESRTALDELTQILRVGSIYPFQQPQAELV